MGYLSTNYTTLRSSERILRGALRAAEHLLDLGGDGDREALEVVVVLARRPRKGPFALDRRGLDAEEAEGDERREADGGPAPRAREDERHTEAEDEDEEGAQVGDVHEGQRRAHDAFAAAQRDRHRADRVEDLLAKHHRHDGADGRRHVRATPTNPPKVSTQPLFWVALLGLMGSLKPARDRS